MEPSTITLIQTITAALTAVIQLLVAYLTLKKARIDAKAAKKAEQSKNPNRSRRKGRSRKT